MAGINEYTPAPERSEGLGKGLAYLSLRYSPGLSNLIYLVSKEQPDLIPAVQHYAARQGIENALYSLRTYLETHDSDIESDFANDTAYAASSIKEFDPELSSLLEELYVARRNEPDVYVREGKYRAILGKLELMEAKYAGQSIDEEYYGLADSIGYSRENLLQDSLKRNLNTTGIDMGDDHELKALAQKHWSRAPIPFAEYVANARAFYEALKTKGTLKPQVSNHLFENALVHAEELLASKA